MKQSSGISSRRAESQSPRTGHVRGYVEGRVGGNPRRLVRDLISVRALPTRILLPAGPVGSSSPVLAGSGLGVRKLEGSEARSRSL